MCKNKYNAKINIDDYNMWLKSMINHFLNPADKLLLTSSGLFRDNLGVRLVTLICALSPCLPWSKICVCNFFFSTFLRFNTYDLSIDKRGSLREEKYFYGKLKLLSTRNGVLFSTADIRILGVTLNNTSVFSRSLKLSSGSLFTSPSKLYGW